MLKKTILDRFSGWLSGPPGRPRRLRALSAAALAFALLDLPAQAAPALPKEPLDQEGAVRLALSGHPALRAATHVIEGSRARGVQAGAWPNPNLTGLVDQVPLSNPVQGNYMVGLTQPLLVSGQRDARLALAKADEELARLEYGRLERAVAADVREAFAKLLFQHAVLAQARLDAQMAGTLRTAAEARFKAGEVARIELLQAEVASNTAERQIRLAENQWSQALATLSVRLGLPAQASPRVSLASPPALRPLPTLEGALSTAIRTRVEFRQAQLQIERETLQRRLAQAGLWTGTEATLALGLVGGGPGFSTSLTLPVPLYRNQGEIAEAEANRARAEAERESLAQRISLEVELAYRDASADASLLTLYDKTYVPQAERFADNARRRYRVGEGSGLEALEAQRALSRVRLEREQAQLEYRQAQARLALAMGEN